MTDAAFSGKLAFSIADILGRVKTACWPGPFQKFRWKFKNWPACDKIVKAGDDDMLGTGHNHQAPYRTIRRVKIANHRPVTRIDKHHQAFGIAKTNQPVIWVVKKR